MSGGKAPHILKLRTRLRQVISLTIQPPYDRRKKVRMSLDRKLLGSHSRSEHIGSEEKTLSQPGIETRLSSPYAVLLL